MFASSSSSQYRFQRQFKAQLAVWIFRILFYLFAAGLCSIIRALYCPCPCPCVCVLFCRIFQAAVDFVSTGFLKCSTAAVLPVPETNKCRHSLNRRASYACSLIRPHTTNRQRTPPSFSNCFCTKRPWKHHRSSACMVYRRAPASRFIYLLLPCPVRRSASWRSCSSLANYASS